MGIYPSTHKTLLDKIQSGDEISWKEFYERYSPAILTICGRFGLTPAEAEDIQQNVMLKIFQNKLIFSYQAEKARFRTYFNRIVRSCIMDYFRKNKVWSQEVSGDEIPDQPAPDTHDEFFDEEWRKIFLQDALDILRQQVEPQTFLIFHTLVFQQKSVKEIADFLQINSSQVYLAKSRCAAKLKIIVNKLKEQDPELNFQWDCR